MKGAFRPTAGLLALFLVLAPVAAAAAPDTGDAADVLNDPLGSGEQSTGRPSTPAEPVESPIDSGGIGDGLFDDLGFAGGFAVGIGAAFLVALLITAAIMGGTRFVTSENVLDNEARRQIFDYVRDNPGIHLRAAATALSLSTTNVLWHLRKLEQANLVASKKFEGYKVFYPSEGGVESRRRAIASSVLRNPHARSILEYVVGNPSAHQREIARAMGVNHGTVRWHLRKLTESGLILHVKKETQSMYYVSELGNQALSGWAAPPTPLAPQATQDVAPPAGGLP